MRPFGSLKREAIYRTFLISAGSLDRYNQVPIADFVGIGRWSSNSDLRLLGFLVGCSYLVGLGADQSSTISVLVGIDRVGCRMYDRCDEVRSVLQ